MLVFLLLSITLWSQCTSRIVPSMKLIGNPNLLEVMQPMQAGMIKDMVNMIKQMQNQSVGEPDRKVGVKLAKLTAASDVNPEELGSYMEGDILQTQASVPGSSALWPNGVVYFQISRYFTRWQRANIVTAMNHIEKYTCIRFRPYTGRERAYIDVVNSRAGCYSSIGRTGRRQELNLQVPGCIPNVSPAAGTAVHELLHALGLPHEQSRSDRDSYVGINYQNIIPANLYNFEKKSFSGLGVPYDVTSVMHYRLNAFSRNGRPTMFLRQRQPQDVQIGDRPGMSYADVVKLNRLYQCQGSQSDQVATRRSSTGRKTTRITITRKSGAQG